MEAPRHILVFRFSALGDVAMTVPILQLLLKQNPQLQVTIVSDPFMAPVFAGIERLHFYGADTKKKYKGLAGLYRLAQQIKKDIPFDAVADLHNVLRTKLLRFFLPGYPKAAIDKGRREKKELTRPINKKLRPLKTGFQRYAEVLQQLGYPLTLSIKDGIVHHTGHLPGLAFDHKPKKWIGIAPFAKHPAKMYPLEKMKDVVRLLAAEPDIELLLFGSKKEADELIQWEHIAPSVHSLAGRYNFDTELRLIGQLQLMISMDSANMHLASMQGIPVVSIWGGTHPWLGFYGWGQPYENAVQTDLPCRPSSVFGNKECPVHGSKGCMQQITPAMIADRVITLIRSKAVPS